MNQPWQWMLFFIIGLLMSFKFLTFCVTKSPWTYLLFWVGTNPREFNSVRKRPVAFGEYLRASMMLFSGLGIVLFVLPQVSHRQLAGALAFWAMILIFHFGLFHLNALFWQSRGRAVKAIMNRPFQSITLREFWGRRWNLAFRDLAWQMIFQPLKKYGTSKASFAVYFFSGLIHDLVISFPARAGYGLPTMYFLIQYFGGEIQKKSQWRGLQGRVFTWAVLILPLPLLFHKPFLENVFLPLTQTLGVL